MHNYKSRRELIREVDTVRTRRALRRTGIGRSVREICDVVYAGDCEERSRLASQLLAASGDEAIEMLLVAAYSGYVGGQVAKTRSDLTDEEMWSLGLAALVRAIRAAARCDGGDFHIIRSMSRDFARAMVRHRRKARNEAAALRLVRQHQHGLPSTSFESEMTSASIGELVEWVATQFDAEWKTAHMMVATRLGGYSLGPAERSTERARNCRDRQRLEAQIRGFVSPAEGLAENVLNRAA